MSTLMVSEDNRPYRIDHDTRNAKRIGVDPDEYRRQRMSGNAWCVACRVFHKRSAFAKSVGRPSGLQAKCRAAMKSERMRRKGPANPYNSKPRQPIKWSTWADKYSTPEEPT